MFLLRKTLFILFLFSPFLSLNQVAVAEQIPSEYIVETLHIQALIDEFPIIVEDEIYSQNIYKIKLMEPSSAILSKLETDQRVIAISPNIAIETPIPDLSNVFSVQSTLDPYWGFKSMNFPSTRCFGSKVDIAVLDTGVDADHPFLKSSIKSGYDAFGTNIEDENGHGTHIIGIIATNAPQLRILPIKTLDKDGYGDLYVFLRGFYYAIENGVDVINMSFGVDNDHQLIYEAVRTAVSNGIAVVAASGNSGVPTLKYPAKYEEVISVGAYDRNEKRAYFSQYGDNLDFVAPGVDIWSSWMKGDYRFQSGTSMATAFVTKTIALLKSVNPNLRNNEIEEILSAASTLLKENTLDELGNGKIDVDKALNIAKRKKDAYNYLPTKYDVPSTKDWKIIMSTPLNHNLFDESLIRVMDIEGKEVKTSVQLDKFDHRIIKVFPPPNGYVKGRHYEIIVEDGLIAKNGKTGTVGTRMSFCTMSE